MESMELISSKGEKIKSLIKSLRISIAMYEYEKQVLLNSL